MCDHIHPLGKDVLKGAGPPLSPGNVPEHEHAQAMCLVNDRAQHLTRNVVVHLHEVVALGSSRPHDGAALRRARDNIGSIAKDRRISVDEPPAEEQARSKTPARSDSIAQRSEIRNGPLRPTQLENRGYTMGEVGSRFGRVAQVDVGVD